MSTARPPRTGFARIGRIPDADEVEMLESEGFPGLLRTGRWFLSGIQTAISVAMLIWHPVRPLGTYVALGLLLAYNGTVLAILHRRTASRLPVRLALTLDLLFLAHTAYWTGGIESPFLAQSHLLVFVAALFYNARGGLISGCLAALFSIAFGFRSDRPDKWNVVRDTAPYFVIVGGYTGFLVGRTKMWFARYRETFERELQREREANLREREREREDRERERAETERNRIEELRRQEMALAREIQQSSLPPLPPNVAGLAMAVVSEPSREVGGDFHVFHADPESTRLGIAIGDVSGKGTAAALVATSIGYVFPHLDPIEAPHAALARLNSDLVRRLPEAAFVSLVYAEMNPPEATLTLWNAGHPAALLFRARGGAVISTPIGDAPPLGLFEDWSAPGRRFDIFPGDTLLICSDGILETRSDAGDWFGEKRLADVFAQWAPRGPEATARAVLEAARAFGTATDDLTVIVCQRTVGNLFPA